MNIYYVYILLNPLKPGTYIYDDLIFEFEPFYVGKGKGIRAYQHGYNFRLKRSHKNHTIALIRKNNLKEIIIFSKNELSEKEALDEEMRIISIIGRRNLELGPLLNRTDGGDGSRNMVLTQEQLKNRGRVHIGNKHRLGKKLSEESKQKIRNSNIVRLQSIEARTQHSIAMTGKKHSIESKEKMIKSRSNAILQYDLEGNFIKEWESVPVASKFYNVSRGELYACIQGRSPHSNHFIWKYKTRIYEKK